MFHGVPRNAAKIPGDLYALRSNVQVEQLEDPSKLPTRLVVLPWGEHKTAKGAFKVNEVTLSAMPANQALTNFDRVCLDFDHNTVPGQPSYKGEPAKIAAYARPVVLSGEGIVYEDIEWTPEGREYVSGGHYRDLSPAVKTDAQGNVVFLHSAAVCRQGAVPDLILCSAESSTNTTTNPTQEPMIYKQMLCSILGLDPEKASDEEITAAADKAANPDKGGEGEEGKAKESTANKTEDGDKVAALSAKVETLSANLERVIGASTATERANIIALAAREGKVVPKVAEKMDLEDLKALCAELPVTVPLEKRTWPGKVETLSADPQITAAQQQVNRTLGISKETFAKHNA
jgi:phage I-like protein